MGKCYDSSSSSSSDRCSSSSSSCDSSSSSSCCSSSSSFEGCSSSSSSSCSSSSSSSSCGCHKKKKCSSSEDCCNCGACYYKKKEKKYCDYDYDYDYDACCKEGPRGKRGKRGKRGCSAPDQGFSAYYTGALVTFTGTSDPAVAELAGWNTDGVGLFKTDFKLDSATGRFRVPADGKYQINAGIAFRLAAGDVTAPITALQAPHIAVHVHRKNVETELVRAAGSWTGIDDEAGVMQATVSGVFKLKKNDRIDLAVAVDPAILGDAVLTVNALDTRANYFSAQRLH